MLSNSLKYIKRKKKRTLIIFTILTVILISLYACFSINRLTKEMEESVFKASNSSFALKNKNDRETINIKDFKEVSKLEGIGKYNYEYEMIGKLKEGKVFESQKSVKIENLNPEYQNLLKVYGVLNTNVVNEFTSGMFNITQGRHIEKNDKNKILIHEKLKEKNNYKIGDKIKLKYIEVQSPTSKNITKKGNEETYEIVGFFRGLKQESYTGLSSDFSENTVFMDYDSSQKLAGISENEFKVNRARYFINNPKEMKEIISKVEKGGLISKNIVLEKNTKAFDNVSEEINSVKSLIQIMTYIIIVGGCAVLSLILILWMRDRVYEIGILLSIGIEKSKIIGQFLLELFFVSLPSLIIAIFTSSLISDKLFKDLILNEKNIGNLSRDIGSIFSFENIILILQSYGMLILIIVLSVLFASFMLLTKKPKEILQKMS